MHRKDIVSITRCFVCGTTNVTLHAIKMTKPRKTAYVCDTHNTPKHTDMLPKDAAERSVYTKDQAIQDRILQVVKQRELEAIQKMNSKKKQGIVK